MTGPRRRRIAGLETAKAAPGRTRFDWVEFVYVQPGGRAGDAEDPPAPQSGQGGAKGEE